jgi:hypothetical protein
MRNFSIGLLLGQRLGRQVPDPGGWFCAVHARMGPGTRASSSRATKGARLGCLRILSHQECFKTPEFNLPVASAAEDKSLDAIHKTDNSAKMALTPSSEALRRNLAKAKARWRAPRPWRYETETQLIRHVVLKWCNDLNQRWSGRGLARSLGVSQTHIWKLTRQFKDAKSRVAVGDIG